MNRIYKVIWNRVRGGYVVVGEHQVAKGKSGGVKMVQAAILSGALVLGNMALADAQDFSIPITGKEAAYDGIRSGTDGNYTYTFGAGDYLTISDSSASTGIDISGSTRSIGINGLELSIGQKDRYPVLKGVNLYGNGKSFSMDSGKVTVLSENTSMTADAYGIYVESNGQTVTLGDLAISASAITGGENATAYALSTNNLDNTIEGGDLVLTASAKSAQYASASGITAWQNAGDTSLPGSTIGLKDLSVTVSAEVTGADGEAYAAGIDGDDKSEIRTGNGDIVISAKSASGSAVYAAGIDSRNGSVSMGDATVKVLAEGVDNTVAAYGIRAWNDNDSVRTGHVDVTVQATGGSEDNGYVEAIALLANGGEVSVVGGTLAAVSEKGYVAGVHANSGTSVTLGSENDTLKIIASGTDTAVGIYAGSNSDVSLHGNVSVASPVALQGTGAVTVADGTTVLDGRTDGFTGVLNVRGKAAVGMSETEAADTLASTSGSALMIAAGSTLYGTTTVGSTATGTAGTGSSLTVGSDGTLIIKAGNGYNGTDPLVTVDKAAMDASSTLKLVNTAAIADNTTIFSFRDGTGPASCRLETDNLLKVVRDNKLVTTSATDAFGGSLAASGVIDEAFGSTGTLARERIVTITADTTAQTAAKTLNKIALMGTAGAAQAVSVNTAGVLSDTLERHGSRLRGYDHRQKGADLWIDLNGHASKASRYSAGNTRYGYKSEMAGATIGMDWAHGNGFTTGAALSFGTGTARGQGNGGGTHNEIDYWGFHLYGIYTHDPFNLIGHVGYLETSNEISQLGYKGEPDVKTFSAGLRVEKPLALNETVTVMPHVGLRYLHIDMDSFSAGGFRYGADKAGLIQTPVGVALNGSLKTANGMQVKPFIDITITPAFGDRKTDNRFGMEGGRVTDTLSTRIAGDTLYIARAGVEASHQNHSFGLNIGVGSGDDGRIDQELMARYRYSF